MKFSFRWQVLIFPYDIFHVEVVTLGELDAGRGSLGGKVTVDS